jgi:hypothetical protein
MANPPTSYQKLSERPQATSVADSDLLLVVQGGVSKKAPVSLVRGNTTGIWDAIYAVTTGNTDPVDALLTSGDTLALVFLSSHNQANWKSPTNAVYTVPTGKKLIVLHALGIRPMMTDTSNRQARLQNVTDGVTVVAPDRFASPNALSLLWEGDNTTPSQFPEVAAGREIRLQLWNADTTKRAVGGIVICRLANV